MWVFCVGGKQMIAQICENAPKIARVALLNSSERMYSQNCADPGEQGKSQL